MSGRRILGRAARFDQAARERELADEERDAAQLECQRAKRKRSPGPGERADNNARTRGRRQPGRLASTVRSAATAAAKARSARTDCGRSRHHEVLVRERVQPGELARRARMRVSFIYTAAVQQPRTSTIAQ